MRKRLSNLKDFDLKNLSNVILRINMLDNEHIASIRNEDDDFAIYSNDDCSFYVGKRKIHDEVRGQDFIFCEFLVDEDVILIDTHVMLLRICHRILHEEKYLDYTKCKTRFQNFEGDPDLYEHLNSQATIVVDSQVKYYLMNELKVVDYEPVVALNTVLKEMDVEFNLDYVDLPNKKRRYFYDNYKKQYVLKAVEE
jgi:hypothetical protein